MWERSVCIWRCPEEEKCVEKFEQTFDLWPDCIQWVF